MSYDIYLYNPTQEERTYYDAVVQPGEYLKIADAKKDKVANDENILIDIIQSHCIVSKLNTPSGHISNKSDQVNFLKDLLPVQAENLPFANAAGYKFRGQGLKQLCTEEITNIDLAVAEKRAFNALQIILKGHTQDDSAKLQVVDKLGTYYPAGSVLDQFGLDWQFDDSVQNQGTFLLPYKASVAPGLCIRIVFNKTGEANVLFKANFFLHKEPT